MRITRLSPTRYRVCAPLTVLDQCEHVAIACDNCLLPFGFHAVSYAAETPYLDEDAVGTVLTSVERGGVIDLECLPADKREVFARQFAAELLAWRGGDDAGIQRIFATNTPPLSVAPRPTFVSTKPSSMTYQYAIQQIDLERRYSDDAKRLEQEREIIWQEQQEKQRAEERNALGADPGARRRDVAGPYDDAFYTSVREIFENPPKKKAAAAAPVVIGGKRKMFVDGEE